jgi:hypothetical protein
MKKTLQSLVAAVIVTTILWTAGGFAWNSYKTAYTCQLSFTEFMELKKYCAQAQYERCYIDWIIPDVNLVSTGTFYESKSHDWRVSIFGPHTHHDCCAPDLPVKNCKCHIVGYIDNVSVLQFLYIQASKIEPLDAEKRNVDKGSGTTALVTNP